MVPLADIPRHMCLKFFAKFNLAFLIFSSSTFRYGCVVTTVFISYSVKIFADVTTLSFFLKRGYCEIFLIPAIFEIKKYLSELLKIKTLSKFLDFSCATNLKKPEILS